MKKILFVFVFFLASNVSADLYKWVDENGVTHYSNTPRLKKTDKDVKTYKETDASHKFSGFKARQKQEPVSESISESISAGIKENCMKEWDDNYRMVEYCVKQQSQAKSWLLSNSAAISPEILRRCKSEWKTNYRMVKYCVENQSKSKRNLNIGSKTKSRTGGNLNTVSKTKRRTGGKWYENGTLHKSSVAVWNNATYGNKLATSADWALTMPKIKAKVMQSGSMDTLRPFASELIKCVNEAAAGKGYESTSTSELVAFCVILMKW